MHAEFWHQRWRSNQIGFHEPQVNPLLVAHLARLELPEGARLFLPLCGKTVDIDWLLSQGHRVAGAELSPVAVGQLFARLGVMPTSNPRAGLERRSAPGLDVFIGDIFQLDAAALGPVDAVYDRAALVALPPAMRRRYVAHVMRITCGAPQLLVTFDYEQSRLEGPPFCVDAAEVRGLYPEAEPTLLSRQEVAGGLKGQCPASEEVWFLRRQPA